MKHDTSKSRVQGEGDYASARKYNQAARAFAGSGQVEEAARNAAPRTPQEQAEMRKAEAEGRSHAKERSKDEAKGTGKRSEKGEQGSELSPGRKPDEKRAPPKGELGKPIPDKLPVPGR